MLNATFTIRCPFPSRINYFTGTDDDLAEKIRYKNKLKEIDIQPAFKLI